MSQPDEFDSRFGESPDPAPYDPYGIKALRELSHDELRSWVRRYDSLLAQPAEPAHLNTGTPGTAGRPGPALGESGCLRGAA